MLTPRQHDLLMFIHREVSAGHPCPSYEAMMVAMGKRSKANIYRLVTGLEGRGFIRRRPGCARSIEILRLPPGVGSLPAAELADAYHALVKAARHVREIDRRLERGDDVCADEIAASWAELDAALATEPKGEG